MGIVLERKKNHIFSLKDDQDIILFNSMTLKKEFLVNPTAKQIMEASDKLVGAPVIGDPAMTTIKIIVTTN